MGHSTNILGLKSGIAFKWKYFFISSALVNYFIDFTLYYRFIFQYLYFLCRFKYYNFQKERFVFFNSIIFKQVHNVLIFKIFFKDFFYERFMKLFLNFFLKFSKYKIKGNQKYKKFKYRLSRLYFYKKKKNFKFKWKKKFPYFSGKSKKIYVNFIFHSFLKNLYIYIFRYQIKKKTFYNFFFKYETSFNFISLFYLKLVKLFLRRISSKKLLFTNNFFFFTKRKFYLLFKFFFQKFLNNISFIKNFNYKRINKTNFKRVLYNLKKFKSNFIFKPFRLEKKQFSLLNLNLRFNRMKNFYFFFKTINFFIQANRKYKNKQFLFKNYKRKFNNLLRLKLELKKVIKRFLLKIFNFFFFFNKKLFVLFLSYILLIFSVKKYFKKIQFLKFKKYDKKGTKNNLILYIYYNLNELFFKFKKKKVKKIKLYKFLFNLQFQYLNLKIFKKLGLSLLNKFFLFYENFFKFKILNFLFFYKNKLKLLNFINQNDLKMKIKFCPINSNVILNDLYLFYQNQKLKRRFSLAQLVWNFYREIKKSFYLVVGLFIKGLGRFTKRQRSSMYKQSFGKLLFRNFNTNFNLKYLNIINKYSQCTIRLYINYNLRFIKNKQKIFLINENDI